MLTPVKDRKSADRNWVAWLLHRRHTDRLFVATGMQADRLVR